MNSPFAAAIIAGGRSTRFGTDKAFHEINGVPLWKWQVQKIEHLMPSEIMISANAEQHFNTQHKVIVDTKPDRGPLGALVDCLNSTRLVKLLILAVDLPNMPLNFLGELVSSGCGSVPIHENGMPEPLAAFYPAEILSLAKKQLSTGELAMRNLVSTGISESFIKPRKIAESEIGFFKNLNYPSEKHV